MTVTVLSVLLLAAGSCAVSWHQDLADARTALVSAQGRLVQEQERSAILTDALTGTQAKMREARQNAATCKEAVNGVVDALNHLSEVATALGTGTVDASVQAAPHMRDALDALKTAKVQVRVCLG